MGVAMELLWGLLWSCYGGCNNNFPCEVAKAVTAEDCHWRLVKEFHLDVFYNRLL